VELVEAVLKHFFCCVKAFQMKFAPIIHPSTIELRIIVSLGIEMMTSFMLNLAVYGFD